MRVKNQGVIGNSKTSNLRLLNSKQQKLRTTDHGPSVINLKRLQRQDLETLRLSASPPQDVSPRPRRD